MSLLFLLFCMVGHSMAATCMKECDGTVDRVCGADGFTYQNPCVAECQGVTVIAPTPCKNDRGGFLEMRSRRFNPGEINRFAHENYRLVGKAKSGVFDPERGASALMQEAELNKGKPAQLPQKDELTSLRYTLDGLVYASSVQTDLKEVPGEVGSTNLNSTNTNSGNQTSTNVGRKLLTVIGTDTRIQITSVSYPYTAGGLVTFSVGPGSYICSGAMISERTVLTAGHCVFDRDLQVWASGVRFSPNRLGSYVPYGTFSYSYVTTFTGWTDRANTNSRIYDIAAIRLADSTVGQRTGYLGVRIPTASYTTTLLTNGYPGDKPSGTYWRTSCTVTDGNVNDGIISHTCDTAGGQSGSPMYTSDNYVRGVHAAGAATTNIAAEFTSVTGPVVIGWR